MRTAEEKKQINIQRAKMRRNRIKSAEIKTEKKKG
jgi:hypothetical protein